MAFPTVTATKTHLDQSTDSPAAARSELVALVDRLNEIITSYAQAHGVCDLDASGRIPAARLPQGAGTGTDADMLDGQHGAFYRNADNLNAGTLPAGRFANSSHGNRSGGDLHAAATQSQAGFMSAVDKQTVDGQAAAIASAVANIDTTHVLARIAGTARVAVGSYSVLFTDAPVTGSWRRMSNDFDVRTYESGTSSVTAYSYLALRVA